MTTEVSDIAAAKAELMQLVNARAFDEARDLATKICQNHPQDAESWFLLGAISGQLGDFVAAEPCCRQAVHLAPENPEAHYNLAVALLRQHRPVEAEPELQEVVRLNPSHVAARHDLGNALQLQGRYEESVEAYRQALALYGEFPDAHFNLAVSLRELGRLDEAIDEFKEVVRVAPAFGPAYEQAAALLIRQFKYDDVVELLTQAIVFQPENAELHFLLGVAYQELGEIEDAEYHYRRTQELRPDHPEVQIGIAAILAMRGAYDQAEPMLRQILEARPDSASAATAFAHYASRFGAEEEARTRLESVLSSGRLNPAMESKVCFALGDLQDRAGAYEQAFACYERGNRLRDARFDRIKYRTLIDALRQDFAESAIGDLPRSGCGSDRPVFIVGMPRSGTSLVEQILASHPRVHGAGELHYIHKLALKMQERFGFVQGYPHCVNQLDTRLLDQLAEEYLAELARRGAGDAIRVTDKMPVNVLHLGLIDLLFPNARVIHCMRDPIDTCLSCYFHNFSGEHTYAYDMDDLIEYFRGYERLMAHWRTVLRVPMLEVGYEELVQDPRPVVEGLVDFVDLPFDERCMSFHETRRTVATASHEQVRKPIYTSSIGRWKNYAGHIEPLLRAFGEDR